MSYIKYQARTLTSADQTENYDSDDSVAYGEMFTAITTRDWRSLSF